MAVDWLARAASHLGPELLGGFVGYMLHEFRHALFKRPGRLVVRLASRPRLRRRR
jgi:hypothetical protein